MNKIATKFGKPWKYWTCIKTCHVFSDLQWGIACWTIQKKVAIRFQFAACQFAACDARYWNLWKKMKTKLGKPWNVRTFIKARHVFSDLQWGLACWTIQKGSNKIPVCGVPVCGGRCEVLHGIYPEDFNKVWESMKSLNIHQDMSCVQCFSLGFSVLSHPKMWHKDSSLQSAIRVLESMKKIATN